jgi:hypothetical protein
MGARAALALGLVVAGVACGGGGGGGPPDAAATLDAARPDGPAPDAFPETPLDVERGRLLLTYDQFLETDPSHTQSNGLSGANVSGVCDLWMKLDPSSQAVFLTITARLEGSTLRDGSPALRHVTTLYRLTGGQDATSADPGSCGGGEYNRMLVSIDAPLHDALVAASDDQGAADAGGAFDLADVPAGGFWRDSHDLAGPHAPFDLSDETNDGAPRGQVQYFRDPASTAAMAPLGRLDLETLVDPHALEIDQDYNCTHDSNPLCSYTFYGPACAPETTQRGVDIYGDGYGPVELAWSPTACFI